jgi:hypothetical protein
MFAQASRCLLNTEAASNNGGRSHAGIAAGRIGGAWRQPGRAIDDRAADAGAAKAC